MSLCLYFRHLSKKVIVSEYLPKQLRAADLFMFILKASKLLSEEDMNFKMSLHSFRHSWGRSVYRYKYDRYYAADKLFEEC